MHTVAQDLQKGTPLRKEMEERATFPNLSTQRGSLFLIPAKELHVTARSLFSIKTHTQIYTHKEVFVLSR